MHTHNRPVSVTAFGPLEFHHDVPEYIIERCPSHADPTTRTTTVVGAFDEDESWLFFLRPTDAAVGR